MRTPPMDDLAFSSRAFLALSPFVAAVEPAYRWNMAGSAIIKPARPDRWVLSVPVKTRRVEAHCDDCDALGTESPSSEAMEACRALAAEFSLTFDGFDPCEKGWGSFQFGTV